MPTAKIYFVRHGETKENRLGIIQGHLDTDLNAIGLEQSEVVAKELRSVPFDAGFSSDLKRAMKTAEIILNYHPGVQLQKQSELRERFMGKRQGLTVSAAASINGPLESPANFMQRFVAWWNWLIAHIESLGPRQDPYYFLFVVHGGFLSSLLANLVESGKVEREEDVLLGIHRCFNCSVSLVDIAETGVPKLVKFGDIKHLDQEQLAMEVVKINVDEL